MSSLNISINEENCELSTLYWIPKFQKNQYLDRYIPCSSTLVLGLTRPGLEAMIYRTRGEHSNHHATDAVLLIGVTM
jgi:3-phenylpropionate/cinnamic acid dioxygenase small subunit